MSLRIAGLLTSARAVGTLHWAGEGGSDTLRKYLEEI